MALEDSSVKNIGGGGYWKWVYLLSSYLVDMLKWENVVYFTIDFLNLCQKKENRKKKVRGC